jgi:hypothetical protein
MQYAVRLHGLHFFSSILYGGIRRSWCTNRRSRICIRILDRHFPAWKISGRLKVLPSPLRLIYFQFPNTYNHQTPRIDHASGLEISCLFCMLVYAFQSHQHTKQLSLRPVCFDPRFFWFGRLQGYIDYVHPAINFPRFAG